MTYNGRDVLHVRVLSFVFRRSSHDSAPGTEGVRDGLEKVGITFSGLVMVHRASL